MSTALLMRGVSALSTAALAIGLLTSSPAHAQVEPADAGKALAWGTDGAPLPLPAELASTPIVDVAGSDQHVIFLTASGRIVTQTPTAAWEMTDDIANGQYRAIAMGPGGSFAAITEGGDLRTWGNPAPSTEGIDVSNLTQVAPGGGHMLGLKADGTVIAWGVNDYGESTVPVGLSNVVKVAAGNDHSYALKADGTVVAWGRDHRSQVAQAPATDVKDIVSQQAGGLALRTDGTVTAWGDKATTGSGTLNLPPASLAGKTITMISGSLGTNTAIDSDGGITTWGSSATFPVVPSEVDGRTLSAISVSNLAFYAISRKVMTINAATVAGTAKQGQTLTGTSATFSGAPEVTNAWLADGAPIAGATGTTLVLTAAQVNKKITYRSTATKGGETLTSDSAPTAAVAGLAPVKVASKTTIAKPKVKKKTATITVKVTRSGGTPTGKVKITVKRGSKTVYNKSVTLKKGVAKITIKKLKKGKHKVSASYAGDTRSKPSNGKAQTFKIK